jgi:hypothetical protein
MYPRLASYPACTDTLSHTISDAVTCSIARDYVSEASIVSYKSYLNVRCAHKARDFALLFTFRVRESVVSF